jgi:hypothetical protein
LILIDSVEGEIRLNSLAKEEVHRITGGRYLLFYKSNTFMLRSHFPIQIADSVVDDVADRAFRICVSFIGLPQTRRYVLQGAEPTIERVVP